MNEKNNNGATTWMVWMAGIIFTILSLVIGFMGNVIWANENKRVEDNVAIREETKEQVTVAVARLEDKIESEIEKIEEKIEKLQIEQTSMKVQGAEILTTLKQVYKEVKQ